MTSVRRGAALFASTWLRRVAAVGSTAVAVGTSGCGTAPTTSAGGLLISACTPGETQACYTGPAGTEGVGTCIGGTATCAADGGGFGDCVGQILPAHDDCRTVEDEACSGKPPVACTPGSVLWAWGGDATGHPETVRPVTGMIVDVDGAGNVAMVSTYTIVTGDMASNGTVVAKYDPRGNALWSGHDTPVAPIVGSSVVQGVSVDAAGNLVFIGGFSGKLVFGATTLDVPPPNPTGLNLTEAYLARWDAGGTPVSLQHLGSGGGLFGLSRVDSAADIVVAGSMASSTALGAGFVAPSEFVAKLGPAQQVRWVTPVSVPMPGATCGPGLTIQTNAAGETWVLSWIPQGTCNEDLLISGPTVQGDWLTRLDVNGAVVWTKQVVNNGMAQVNFAIDGEGNAVVDAIVPPGSTLELGGVPWSAGAGSIAVFAKFDASGNYLWGKQIAATGALPVLDMSEDGRIAAAFGGSGVDLGSGPIGGTGVLAELDGTGALLWSTPIDTQMDNITMFDVRFSPTAIVLTGLADNKGFLIGDIPVGNLPTTPVHEYAFIAAYAP